MSSCLCCRVAWRRQLLPRGLLKLQLLPGLLCGIGIWNPPAQGAEKVSQSVATGGVSRGLARLAPDGHPHVPMQVQGQSLVQPAAAQIMFCSVPLWSGLLAAAVLPGEQVGLLTVVGGTLVAGAGLVAALGRQLRW